MAYTLKMRLWRGDQSGGDLQDYDVEVETGEVVLDAIHRVQATQAGDLAVRWNCKAGKCGSCSAEINGRPKLMCMCRLSDYDESETITVTPMRAFPVIRDLVTDVSYNYEKAQELPYAELPPRDADGTGIELHEKPLPVMPAELKKYFETPPPVEPVAPLVEPVETKEP